MSIEADARQASFLTGPIWPALIRLSAPNVIALFIQSSVSVVEAWFLGAEGKIALAGVALVFPVLMLNMMLSAGAIGGAISGATARVMGAGKQEAAEAILRTAIVISLGGSLVFALAMGAWDKAIFEALGGSPEVVAAATEYSRVLFPGILALWLYNMLSSVVRGSGDMKRPAVAMMIVASTHAILAAWLVGGDVMPHMQGAAWAFVGAFSVGSLVMLGVVLRPGADIPLRIGVVPLRVLVPVLQKGMLASAQSVATMSNIMLATALMAPLGAAYIAGYGIGARLEMTMIPIIFGTGAASIAMVGANVGAGQRARAVAIAWRGAAMAGIIVGSIGLVVAVFPELWAGFFTDSEAVSQACKTYLRIVTPFYFFFAVGLNVYFASQGLNTLLIPVLGSWVRLVIMAAGVGLLALVDLSEDPQWVFAVVAISMVGYGLFNTVTLRLKSWY